jgi:hypothetical protein
MPGMSNQYQYYRTDHTQCLPPLFAIFNPVLPRKMQREMASNTIVRRFTKAFANF